ncbi:MAG: nucleotidyltransferase domain-containing protein [Deltaproteobacteria bacterium]|jgi:predicted nucleotidyltransferase|nr:nucleotidyltransferase domain-containing protein [Deltaproteobacteria bacterium]
MALDIEKVKATVKIYADEVRQTMSVVRVFLYGSYAKGTANEHSDVDVCFFLADYEDKNCIDILKKLLKLSHKYKIAIEPNVVEVSDIDDEDDPYVKEVLRTGIEIF